MGRIIETDLAATFAPWLPRWLGAIGVGLICAGIAGLVRIALDLALPGVVPFALIPPAVMVATLAGGGLAGLVTLVVATCFTWFVLVPRYATLLLPDPHWGATMIVVVLSGLVTLALADVFRRAVRAAAAERDRQIAERDLFLAEFEHRVKNNFAVVASLLELQKRGADPATAAALSAALARVESIARAHRHLYRGTPGVEAVQIADYLNELCQALGRALVLGERIRIRCAADQVQLPRDRAVSIGLIVNELGTNAAKHAFAGREQGEIIVDFATVAGGWVLSVADNGTGFAPRDPAERREGGLGTRLVEAFARQARGTVQVETGAQGTRTVIAMEA